MRSWLPIAVVLPLVVPLRAGAAVTNQRTGLPYGTIADAISNAAVGDTLVLDAGLYNEAVVIDRDLILEGVGQPTIDWSGSGNAVIDVETFRSLTMRGITLTSSDRRGIDLQGSNTLVLDTVTFDGTNATSHGGGVRALSVTSMTLTDVVFDGATATLDGGGVYMDADALAPVTLTDVSFVDTTASPSGRGGGVRIRQAAFTCLRCSFNGTSALHGGAIHDDGASNVVVTASSFIGTTALANGGAIYALGSASLEVSASSFCNSDGSTGGTIYGTSGGTIRNSTFSAGSAGSGGAAVFGTTAGTWLLENDTIVGSIGDGLVFSGVAVDATIVNTAIVDSTGFGITMGSGAVATRIDYNLLYGNASGAVSGASATNSVVAPPDFATYIPDGDCTNDQLWPAPGSALLDAGDPAMSDPDGSRSDIGAYGGAGADPAIHDDADADGFPFLLDCDDTNPEAWPGAEELCDLTDNDCNGAVDDDPTDIGQWYPDCDGDGQGATNEGVESCFEPAPAGCPWLSTGVVGDLAWSDCDDGDDTVFYGADEYCDDLGPVDSNCDGDPVAGAVDAPTFYVDADGDGFGDAEHVVCAFSPPLGDAGIGGDCDDTVGTIYPGAPDTCGDGVDQDCNGGDGIDADLLEWYPDDDLDGFGDDGRLPVLDCGDLSADHTLLADATDCDDTDQAVFPGAPELCNDTDDDCNGTVDDVPDPVQTWYEDGDGDGHGDERFPVTDRCAPEGEWIPDGGDCNDDDAEISPSASERCNGRDDDCDERVDADDPNVVDAVDAWSDWDGDGFGTCHPEPEGCDPTPLCVADLGTGWADNDNDCDDGSAEISPSANEILGNSVDENCDGVAQGEEGPGTPDDPKGCNCSTAPGAPWLLAAPLLLVLRRRRG